MGPNEMPNHGIRIGLLFYFVDTRHFGEVGRTDSRHGDSPTIADDGFSGVYKTFGDDFQVGAEPRFGPASHSLSHYHLIWTKSVSEVDIWVCFKDSNCGAL